MTSAGTLTAFEAYDAMFAFLETYWERGGKASDELAGLLGSMSRETFSGEMPADKAQWDDWLQAIEKVKQKRPTQNA